MTVNKAAAWATENCIHVIVASQSDRQKLKDRSEEEVNRKVQEKDCRQSDRKLKVKFYEFLDLRFSDIEDRGV